jgi:hypothetical protein
MEDTRRRSGFLESKKVKTSVMPLRIKALGAHSNTATKFLCVKGGFKSKNVDCG